jgi:hypothetical protein
MAILDRHQHGRITEVDRVVMALYLVEKGFPTSDGWENQAHFLSVLFQWPREKTERLLEQAVAAGYADHTGRPRNGQ